MTSSVKRTRTIFRAIVGLVAAVVLTGATRANADDGGKGIAYCYVNLPQSTGYIENQPTYFTAVYAYTGGASNGLFSQYVAKKYSLRSAGPEGCSYSSSQTGVENSLKQRLAQVRASGHTAIETGWTKEKHDALMGEAKNSPPPPPVAAPKPQAPPPPSAAQTAYEKAMAAQRPASNTAANQNAGGSGSAGPASAPSGAESEKYSFCYTVGSQAGPSAGTSRPNYYVTGIFKSSATLRPAGAFQQVVRAAHPREALGTPVCSTPQPMDATENARTNQVNKQRAQYNIVELNWKPE